MKLSTNQWLIVAAVIGVILYNNSKKEEETCEQTSRAPSRWEPKSDIGCKFFGGFRFRLYRGSQLLRSYFSHNIQILSCAVKKI